MVDKQIMKPSKYNIILEIPENGKTIIFNSLYGSLSIWNKFEMQEVNRLLKNPLDSKVPFIKDVLVNQRYLIDDSVDERSIIESRKSAGIADKNRLDLIIMPTLDCNFSCVYCYELKRPSKMNEETEKRIKSFLSQQVPKYKFIKLLWFGGEPLLGYPQIISITNHLKKIAENEGIYFISHITTNGYLLNRKIIQELIRTGIYEFQITLDGSPEAHDKLRRLKNGRPTFNRIFKNLIDLARAHQDVRISLRVNFNQENLHSIPALLEMIPDNIRSQIRIVYQPIFGKCSINTNRPAEIKETSEEMVDYYVLAEKKGYNVVIGLESLQTGKLVYCHAERKNQFIINYNGDVYKCGVGNFMREERVGFIGEDGIFIKYDENWDQWYSISLFEESCYSCSYLPLCMGGCRKARLERKETGSYCPLIPHNVNNLLKKIILGQIKGIGKK